ncbi:MAG: MAPEG family protein [Panacagrimonas sp.]
MNRSLALSYAILTPALVAVCVGLYLIVERAAPGVVDPKALIAPVVALVGLTGVVWVLMFVFRNFAVARGDASILYYQAYRASEAPSEWIERPARAFMNLLEVPVLFYVLCILMLVTRICDAAQVQLAWVFVGLRALHALIYIGVNHVPSRLGAYVASGAALVVMWFRFAAEAM